MLSLSLFVDYMVRDAAAMLKANSTPQSQKESVMN